MMGPGFSQQHMVRGRRQSQTLSLEAQGEAYKDKLTRNGSVRHGIRLPKENIVSCVDFQEPAV